MLDRPREAGTITDERSTGAQAYRRLMYLWFFDPQRRSGLIGPLANPVMVKEQRTRKLGRGNWMMRLLGATAVISLALMLAAANASTSRLGGGAGDPQAVQKLGGVIVVLQVALIMLLTPALASGLISAERESRGWQLLQMTPMSAVTIVVGKLASVAVILLLLLAATLPGYLVLLYIKPSMSPVVVQVLASLVLTSVMALLVSAAISSLFEKTAAATTAAYVLLIGLCGGTMLIWLGRDAPFGHGLVEAVLRWNPLAAMLDLLGTPGFGQYELVEANWWIMSGLCVTALLVLVVQVWRLTRPT
jgi:ABC-type transport system involved in multi-copper enzyme maturation permease subunit